MRGEQEQHLGRRSKGQVEKRVEKKQLLTGWVKGWGGVGWGGVEWGRVGWSSYLHGLLGTCGRGRATQHT